MSVQHPPARPGKEAVQSARWLAADESLRDAVSRFATQTRFEDDFINAFLEFWGAEDPDDLPVDLARETPEFLLTFEWYLYDYREMEGGQRIIDLFAEVEGSRLPETERDFLALWREASLTPFEIMSVRPGRDFTVRSLIDGASAFVQDEPTSKELRPGDLLVARLLPAGPFLRPSSVFRTFGAGDQPRLMATLDQWHSIYREENPGATWQEFLREEGYLFNDYALERQALAERLGDQPREAAAGDAEEEPLQIDPDGTTSTSKEYLEARYRAWIDRATPALGTRSPSQAVTVSETRPRVMELLREMGQIEASYALVGEPAMELAQILPLLNLTMDDLQ